MLSERSTRRLSQNSTVNVISLDGRKANLTAEAAAQLSSPEMQQVMLHLEDGRRLVVPANLLEPQPDGSYRLLLDLSRADASYVPTGKLTGDTSGETLIVLPVVEEDFTMHKRQVDAGGVRVTTHVESEEHLVDEPGYIEEIEVTRTPLNQVVQSPPEPRQEGDDWIIPILEEVLVVEKRLMVKEELRISKHRREVRQPQRVTLRRLNASIENLPPAPQPPTAGDD
jgi:uncharacterized protein (TIGR02271 family)